MYNNEMTYDKKWENEENKQYLQVLFEKYLNKTPCWSDCPSSWAKEVLEIMETLQKYDVEIDQVKEKYGTLRVYHTSNADVEDEIESLIKECEVKLSRKGAYFPLKEMYDWSTSRYVGDDIVKTYPYRKFITELEVNG